MTKIQENPVSDVDAGDLAEFGNCVEFVKLARLVDCEFVDGVASVVLVESVKSVGFAFVEFGVLGLFGSWVLLGLGLTTKQVQGAAM